MDEVAPKPLARTVRGMTLGAFLDFPIRAVRLDPILPDVSKFVLQRGNSSLSQCAHPISFSEAMLADAEWG